MTASTQYTIVFPAWYDERGEWEAEQKGWLQGVAVYTDGPAAQPLHFYDPVRLAQDLENEAKQGRPFIAYKGLIVVPEVTRNAIVEAIEKLVELGYFESTQLNHHEVCPNGSA